MPAVWAQLDTGPTCETTVFLGGFANRILHGLAFFCPVLGLIVWLR
jgi:hypothetical protein